jgi:hypothetical protein
MKNTVKYFAPWVAAAAIGAALALAPIAGAAVSPTPHSGPAATSAGTDPLVPFGTYPHSPYVFGYHTSNHDESNTTNGQLDTAF